MNDNIRKILSAKENYLRGTFAFIKKKKRIIKIIRRRRRIRRE